MSFKEKEKTEILVVLALIPVAIGVLGFMIIIPRESLEAWATFMNAIVRPAVAIVTGY